MFRTLLGMLMVLVLAPVALADLAEGSTPVVETAPIVDPAAPSPSFSVTSGMPSSVRVGEFELSGDDCVPVLVVIGNDDGSFDIEDGFGGKIDFVPPGTGSIDLRVPRYAWKTNFTADGMFYAELVLADDAWDGPVVNGSISVGCRKRASERCNYSGTCCTGPPSDPNRRCGSSTDFSVGGGQTATVSCNDPAYSHVHISTW